MGLKLQHVRDFLSQMQLLKSGNKQELRERIEGALETGAITDDDLVRLLDSVAPWGKQHVILFNGPADPPAEWRTEAAVRAHLRRYKVDGLLNASIPLVLPTELELSSIDYQRDRLRILAVERRDYTDRIPDLDTTDHLSTGETIEFRAHRRSIERGLVIFEWNLVANTAMIQITELPSGSDYEAVRDRLAALLSLWLDISRFQSIEVHNSIKKLHQAEDRGSPEARSHGIDYALLSGRKFGARSPTASTSVVGDKTLDEAFRKLMARGVGHQGNFYWLPASENPSPGNGLDAEVHVIIVGNKGRVNFKTDNTEAAIRYVLTRVRALSN